MSNLRHYRHSLRLKLDDIIINEAFEKKILENIRYCRNLVGGQFRVVFWSDKANAYDTKEFVKRNEHLLFEVNTKITKKFAPVWYLIRGLGDKSDWRYKSESYTSDDILDGIASFIKLVKHIKNRDKTENESRHSR
ncbi:hypothetical protein CL614_10570 [archaeon]|jgi:hypothetical protein|nr:hypothetical protein [archaeon]|tara:strand:+ start:1051 stop:1458 length:408 start_codon:yes stop_codon:yes gene_type:complete